MKKTYQQYYADIARAIRGKGGSGTYTPAQMASAIRALDVSGLGDIQTFPSSGGYQRHAMTDPANYTAIAGAIRAKSGTTDSIAPARMASYIHALIRNPVSKVRVVYYDYDDSARYSWMGVSINGSMKGGSAKDGGDYCYIDITNVPVGTWDVYGIDSDDPDTQRYIGSLYIPDDYTGTSLTIAV